MKPYRSPPRIFTAHSNISSFHNSPTLSPRNFASIHRNLNAIRESHNIYRPFIPSTPQSTTHHNISSSSSLPLTQHTSFRYNNNNNTSYPSSYTSRLLSSNRSLAANNLSLMNKLNTFSSLHENYYTHTPHQHQYQPTTTTHYISTAPNQTNLQESLRNIRNSNNELRSEKIDNEKNYINIQNETTRLKKDVDRAKHKKQSLEEINAELKRNYGNIHNNFNKENVLLDSVFQKTNKDLITNTQQSEMLLEMNSNLKKTKNDYEALVNELKGTVAVLTKKQETFEQTHTNSKQILTDKGLLSTEKDNKINELLDINTQLTNELESHDTLLQRELESFNHKEKNTQSISPLQKDIEQKNKQLDDMYKELMRKDELIETLKANYTKVNQRLIEGGDCNVDDLVSGDDKNKIKNVNDDNTMKEMYNQEVDKKAKLVNALKELNGVYEKLIESQEKMKTFYENEVSKAKAMFQAKQEALSNNDNVDSNNNNMNEDKEQLQKLIKEQNSLKQDYATLINKVKEIPQLENEFREIVTANLELKQQQEILKKAKQLYILKAQKRLLEAKAVNNE